jgi:hypothetical protein
MKIYSLKEIEAMMIPESERAVLAARTVDYYRSMAIAAGFGASAEQISRFMEESGLLNSSFVVHGTGDKPAAVA